MVHDPLRPQPDDAGQDLDSDDEVYGAPESDAEGGGERVAKLLARSGVGSRRDVERLIGEGRVAINGRTLTTPAVKVEPNDILTVDGEVVGEPEPARLFRYHKPVGLVTTHKDPAGRPTVFKALPDGLPRLISVGRLDINSEGLLLLTNDGALARALELPSSAVVRRYRARAHGRTTQERLDTLSKGITVEGVRYGPIEARLDKARDGPQGANLWLTVTLNEGKNREVRRVLEALGLKVNRLIRLAYGPLALGTLGVGELEEVGPRVVREQFGEHIEADNMPTGERPLYRSPRKSASRRAQDEAKTQQELAPIRAPKEKPVYKAGWAKPKPKVRQPLKDKADAKVRASAATRPARKPKPAARAAAPTRPGIVDRPTTNPRGRPAGAKAAAPRSPGSARGPGPAAGPRGPKPSASPAGTRAARPPGPRKPGGPARRG
ncbi:pseudouridine synthase [Phenylobacterium sp.]|uniref:pseudouridine synthase n=1 Tax=Phenylobacterium sp. TaxID=1871053 RepID=UPI0025FD71F5|nr:pseudouridine synthase [Phenylobacterium sp.]